MKFVRILTTLCALVALTSVAGAVEVYINGTKVTGAVRDQAFQKVDVQFNAQGDVFINAPGYTVNTPAVANEDTPSAPAQRTVIIVNNQQTGHYRVILKVNGTKVGDVASTRRQHQVDISGALRSGKNEVEIVYYPIPDAPKVGEIVGTEILVGLATDNQGEIVVSRILGKHTHKTGNVGAESVIVPFEAP